MSEEVKGTGVPPTDTNTLKARSVAVPMLLEPLGYGLLGSMPSVASAHPEWVRAQV